MSEAVIPHPLQGTRITEAPRRFLGLLALLGINGLLLSLTFVVVFHRWQWLQGYDSVRLALGVLFAQVYLLAFWGAFRGGRMVTRLGAPLLAVMLLGFLAIELLPRSTNEWGTHFLVRPVPLLTTYLVGLGLLLPLRWWSGKTLLFPGEEPPPGRPRQFRLGQIAVWILLMGATFGLTRATTGVELVDADLELVLLGPAMLGFVSLLSIPLVRGVFEGSRAATWSVCGLLLVLGIGLLVGGAEFSLLWHKYARRRTGLDYLISWSMVVSCHGIAGLILLGNFTAVRWLGGRFATRGEPMPLTSPPSLPSHRT